MQRRILASFVWRFGVPFGDFPRIRRENIEFEGRDMKRMKRRKAFSAAGTDEEDHVAGDALFLENVLEHVFAEGRLDLRGSDWQVVFNVNVDGFREGIWRDICGFCEIPERGVGFPCVRDEAVFRHVRICEM